MWCEITVRCHVVFIIKPTINIVYFRTLLLVLSRHYCLRSRWRFDVFFEKITDVTGIAVPTMPTNQVTGWPETNLNDMRALVISHSGHCRV